MARDLAGEGEGIVRLEFDEFGVGDCRNSYGISLLRCKSQAIRLGEGGLSRHVSQASRFHSRGGRLTKGWISLLEKYDRVVRIISSWENPVETEYLRLPLQKKDSGKIYNGGDSSRSNTNIQNKGTTDRRRFGCRYFGQGGKSKWKVETGHDNNNIPRPGGKESKKFRPIKTMSR